MSVVITDLGTSRARISLSYPGTVKRVTVEGDLANIQAACGWQINPPTLTAGREDTQAFAQIANSAAGRDIIWGVAAALRRYNRIAVVAMGVRTPAGKGRLSNRFVNAQWHCGGGVLTCVVDIRDRSFRTVRDLSAPGPSETQPSQQARADRIPVPSGKSTAGSPAWRWGVLLALALLAAAATYWLCSRVLSRSA